jgi:hypothetical protein
MAGETLGRSYDFVPSATGLLLAIKRTAGITFFCQGGDTYNLKWAATYNGSPSELIAIGDYYINPSLTGAGAWTEQQAADAPTYFIEIASGMAAFYIDGSDLPSTGTYVAVVPAGSGVVSAIIGDLDKKTTPPYLPAWSGSAS